MTMTVTHNGQPQVARCLCHVTYFGRREEDSTVRVERATGVGIIMRRHRRMTYAETMRVLGGVLAKCDARVDVAELGGVALIRVPPN